MSQWPLTPFPLPVDPTERIGLREAMQEQRR
jgi:hypothetical protein